VTSGRAASAARGLLAAAAAALLLAGCGNDADSSRGEPVAATGDSIWVVGDGGVSEPDDDRVAEMIERQGIARLLYLGDVYQTGTAAEFRDFYDPSFGRFKEITRPVPGNHEWPGRAEGYDPYWADLLRSNGGRHYYSFDVGSWHFVALNSEEPIGPGSPQFAWLQRDLAGRRGNCAIAMTHSPRYTVGRHGYDETLAPVWDELSGKAVALLSGHDHNYQRLKPEDGITQFVVGAGGRALYDVDEDHRRLAASDDDSFGALRLELKGGRADYTYVTVDAGEGDSGSLRCSPRG